MSQVLPAEGGLRRVIGDGHGLPDGEIDLTPEQHLELFRGMVLLRTYDERSVVYHRQGRIGTYAIFWNHEAMQAGSVFALEERDWVFPSYRDSAIGLLRGMPVSTVLSWWRGHPAGWWDPREFNVASICVPIATQVPHAVGFAWGSKLKNEDRVALVSFGDGATSEGAFHEGATFAGVMKAPVVLLCNNNQWAISTPLSKQTAAPTLADKAIGYGIPAVRVDGNDVLAVYDATREAVVRARGGEGPTFIEAVTYRAAPHATADDPSLYVDEERVEEARENECLGRYERYLERLGLLSGEQTADDPRRRARAHAGRDRRGRGRAACGRLARLRARVCRAAPVLRGRPRRAQADPRAMSERLLVEAVNDALHVEMERDASVLVIGEDVGRLGGVFRATAGLQERFGADRCVDTPLAEAGILGTAVGLCMAGWRPVCEMQYDAFSYPSLDQLINHVGRYRWRTRGKMSFPIVIRMPYGGGVRAPELHDDSPETYYVHTPGVKVAIPSNPADAKGLLAAAIRDPDPVVVFEPKLHYRTAKGEVPDGEHVVPLGEARVAREGTDITIVAYGAMVPLAESAADALASEASVEVLDIRSLKPFDETSLLASVSKTGRAVLVQEAPRTCGYAAEIAAVLAEKAIYDLRAPVVRVTGYDVPYPYWQIEDAYMPSVERVVDAARRVLAS